MPQGTYTNQGFSGTQEDETVLSSAGETKIQVAQVGSEYSRRDLLCGLQQRKNKLPDSQAVTFSWSNLTVKVLSIIVPRELRSYL